MLPDFPDSKNKLKKFWDHYADMQRQKQFFLPDALEHRNYEGNSWITNKEDGSNSESNYKDIEASFELRNDEIPDLNPLKVAEKISQIAKDMADQMGKQFFETMLKEMQNSGRMLQSDQHELNKEAFLQSVESILISFDKKGNPNLPTVFVSPEDGEKLKPQLKDWNEDVDMKQRFDHIIERKREEWHVRENSRKLVD